jgi:hypothetical protein
VNIPVQLLRPLLLAQLLLLYLAPAARAQDLPHCPADTPQLQRARAELTDQLGHAYGERAFYGLVGPVAGTLVSGVALGLLVNRAVWETGSERSIAAGVAVVPGAVFLASVGLLGYRAKQRHRIGRELERLLARQAQLSAQLEPAPYAACAPSTPEAVRAERAQLSRRLTDLERQLDQHSLIKPGALVLGSVLVTSVFLAGATLIWVMDNPFSEYPGEAYNASDRRWVRALASSALVSSVGIVASSYWFRSRRRERERLVPAIKQTKRGLHALELSPQVAQHSFGLSLQGRF